MRDFLKGVLASVTTNKVLTTCQVWVINFISLFTEFVVCFSYFSLCTVKRVPFYLYALLPVQFQQQLCFNTFITSFFLTGKQTKGHAHTLDFPSLVVQKHFSHLLPVPFRFYNLKQLLANSICLWLPVPFVFFLKDSESHLDPIPLVLLLN